MLLLGGAMTAAHVLRAQQQAMPVVGYLAGDSASPNSPSLAAFRQGLSETGYIEGQNFAIEYRWVEGRYDRLPVLAADCRAREQFLDRTPVCGNIWRMIRSFGDRRTEALFLDQFVSDFQGIARRAKRKLEAINAASGLSDLAVPPSNRLERLRGDLRAFYSIRINEQWRVIFRWRDGEPCEVRIVDYH